MRALERDGGGSIGNGDASDGSIRLGKGDVAGGWGADGDVRRVGHDIERDRRRGGNVSGHIADGVLQRVGADETGLRGVTDIAVTRIDSGNAMRRGGCNGERGRINRL